MTLLAIAMAFLMESPAPYPIPPQPLRWLYRDADLVVVAKPGETVLLDKKEDVWRSSKVVLAVEKTLKGRCGGEITVFYSPNMVCPAPDRYPAGRTILAFLSWNKELQGYIARGLSYATKALEPGVLAVYVDRIEELAKIPAEKPEEELSGETLEWLVRCIEQPTTRWEGAYEFNRSAGRRGGAGRPDLSVRRLSKDQLKRVVDALVCTNVFRYDDLVLAEVLKEVADDRITTFLANELRFQHARGELLLSDEVMSAIADRVDLPGGKDLITRFRDSENDELRLKLLGQFLDLVEQK